MPSGTELQRITAYPNKKWVCSYIVWAKCGCTYKRNSIILVQETRPTDEQILKAIAEDEDND